MTRLLPLVLVLLSGCVAPEAIAQCDAQAKLCHDDAIDPALPLEARQGGADNMRAWCQQRVTLTGDPVPASLGWPPLPPELDPPLVPGSYGATGHLDAAPGSTTGSGSASPVPQGGGR